MKRIGRREFMKGAAGALLTLAGCRAAAEVVAQREPGPQKFEGPPIIDVHTHLPPGVPFETIARRFDEAGVEKAAIMARAGKRAEDTLEFRAKYLERVIPFVPFQVRGWARDEPGFLLEVEGHLRTGKFKGMGEIVLRHYGVPEIGAEEFDIPADSVRMKEVVRLAARYDVPALIHLEAEPGTIAQLDNILRFERGAKIIWGHCGRATAEVVGGMLGKHPNLYCDTAALDRTRSYGREKSPITEEDGKLKPEWKSLFERHPGRFMFGVDGVTAAHYRGPSYVRAAMAQRAILDQLARPAARAIGYETARAVLRV